MSREEEEKEEKEIISRWKMTFFGEERSREIKSLSIGAADWLSDNCCSCRTNQVTCQKKCIKEMPLGCFSLRQLHIKLDCSSSSSFLDLGWLDFFSHSCRLYFNESLVGSTKTIWSRPQTCFESNYICSLVWENHVTLIFSLQWTRYFRLLRLQM